MFSVPGKAETIEAMFKKKFTNQQLASIYVDEGLEIGWKNGEAVVYRGGLVDGKTMPFSHAYESELLLIEQFLKPRGNQQLGNNNPMIPIGDDLPSSNAGDYEDSGHDLIPDY